MMMLQYEKDAWTKGYQQVAGCDEAGRGALAGPVVAAAVVLNQESIHLLGGITDSKQLTEKKRYEYLEIILENLTVGIGIIEASEIDEINIYESSRKAMLVALKNIRHDYVLTDAMPLPGYEKPAESIIKGDQLSLSISCASIVAKCVRDTIMYEHDASYPAYGFGAHKGYGTKRHKQALQEFGIVDGLHRLTYKPIQELFIEQETLF